MDGGGMGVEAGFCGEFSFFGWFSFAASQGGSQNPLPLMPLPEAGLPPKPAHTPHAATTNFGFENKFSKPPEAQNAFGRSGASVVVSIVVLQVPAGS